jgi:transcriptional regulator with XRE-family HTH domain
VAHEKLQLNNTLRKHRRLMGYKLKDVALILKLKTTSRISDWENGHSTPSLKNLVKLSIVYCTLIDQFYHDLKLSLRNEINQSHTKHIRRKTRKQ